MIGEYSEDYQKQIQAEYDKLKETAFWKEYIKLIFGLRREIAKSYETRKLDSLLNISTHMEEKGEIAGIEKSLRLILRIIDRKEL